MLKRPALSVWTARVFSINAGLLASTVTPGSTAPELSRTSPAMVLVCAVAATGSASRQAAVITLRANLRIAEFSFFKPDFSFALKNERLRAKTEIRGLQYPCPRADSTGVEIGRSLTATMGVFCQKVPIFGEQKSPPVEVRNTRLRR